jgi:zinc transport system ATP-binding protein
MFLLNRNASSAMHQPAVETSNGVDAQATAPPSQPLLRVSGASIEINGRTIVRNVTFALPKSASLAVIGPNGSGKTLLLKALLGLLPCSGSFQWLSGVRLGYVPQKVLADPQMPMLVHELLEAKMSVQKLTHSDMKGAVEWVGISDLMESRLGALSSGQLQRVLIALAMIGAPDALLIDEPTSSLDEAAEEHIYDLLERARQTRGTTIILVSHDLSLVRHMASHVLCLNAGTASFGTAERMLRPDVLEAVYGRPLLFHAHALDKI